jgi:ParB-like chromosome segregation protein Spo0J
VNIPAIDNRQHSLRRSGYAAKQEQGYSQLQVAVGLALLAALLAFFIPRATLLLEEAQRLQVMAETSRFRAAVLTLRASWWSTGQRPVWLKLPLVGAASEALIRADTIRPNATGSTVTAQSTTLEGKREWQNTTKFDAVAMTPSGWPIDWRFFDANDALPQQPARLTNGGCQRLWNGLQAEGAKGQSEGQHKSEGDRASEQAVAGSWARLIRAAGLNYRLQMQQALASQQGCFYLLAAEPMAEGLLQSLPQLGNQNNTGQAVVLNSAQPPTTEESQVMDAWLNRDGQQGLIVYNVQSGRITWHFR